MNRYYDTATHTETLEESETTIISTDARVKDFFKPLPDGYKLVIVNDLPTFEFEPLPTQAEIDARLEKKKINNFTNVVQTHLETKANAKGYESILSACSYASGTNHFQSEGRAFVAWRGDIWAYCYQVLSDVKAGIRTEPTTSELIIELDTQVPLVLPQ